MLLREGELHVIEVASRMKSRVGVDYTFCFLYTTTIMVSPQKKKTIKVMTKNIDHAQKLANDNAIYSLNTPIVSLLCRVMLTNITPFHLVKIKIGLLNIFRSH